MTRLLLNTKCAGFEKKNAIDLKSRKQIQMYHLLWIIFQNFMTLLENNLDSFLRGVERCVNHPYLDTKLSVLGALKHFQFILGVMYFGLRQASKKIRTSLQWETTNEWVYLCTVKIPGGKTPLYKLSLYLSSGRNTQGFVPAYIATFFALAHHLVMQVKQNIFRQLSEMAHRGNEKAGLCASLFPPLELFTILMF